jgi:5-methylcytosine-specific restriction endonuclease McrA
MDYSRQKPKWAKTRLELSCDYCKKEFWEARSKVLKKKRHYCSMKCYALDRKENWTIEEQPTYKGMTPYESHRKYVKKNLKRIAHLKARRYARQKNAEGSHTLEEWQDLCKKANYLCVNCGENKKLTKDHIKPLSEGGTDYIENIQPLCRNCNSRKWKFYENPELIK